jgi:pterin-4a-carbinolamine dehydratase
VSGWRRVGDAAVLELEFRDFDEAMRFCERVAVAAEDYERRPDMCISEFNHVRLTVANLKHAGFTKQEERLMHKVDSLVTA